MAAKGQPRSGGRKKGTPNKYLSKSAQYKMFVREAKLEDLRKIEEARNSLYNALIARLSDERAVTIAPLHDLITLEVILEAGTELSPPVLQTLKLEDLTRLPLSYDVEQRVFAVFGEREAKLKALLA